MTSPVAAPAPSRMLTPDLARGFTLFGIAGANLATAWAPVPDAPLAKVIGGVVDNSVADKVAVIFGALFLHVRGLPMFATLLGFGVGLISMSLYRRQFPLPAARKAITKRYGFLALFGLVHCLFMFYGDIMLTYGISGMLLALCLTFRDKVLLIIAGAMFATNVLIMSGIGLSLIFLGDGIDPTMFSPDAGMAESMPWIKDSYLGQLLMGAVMVIAAPFSLPQVLLMIGPCMLVGFVAARRGVLANIPAHRALLIRTSLVGLAVMVLSGLPLGLSAIGVLPPHWEMGLFFFGNGIGAVTGPAIVAMIALACHRAEQKVNAGGKLPAPLVAVQALGKRSMSGYVLQSLLCMIFVTSYGLGLGQGRGAADTLAIAVIIWLLSLIGAYILELKGKKGPLEALHRRLSYGKDGLPQRWTPPAVSA